MNPIEEAFWTLNSACATELKHKDFLIKELEQIMLRFTGALIFVSHDRMFLQRIATRIVEIDRARLFDQTCDYATFLVRRSADRQVEETKNALFDKKLRQEEAWIRGGIKARGTRKEGRVREL